MVWDDGSLYVGVTVTDDKVVNTAPGGRLFQGDCVEVYLDTATDRDMSEHVHRSHTGKFFCTPAQQDAPTGRLGSSAVAGAIDHVDVEAAKMISRMTGNGYTVELRIPTKALKLAVGKVWGLDLSLIDYDEGAPAYERSQLVWSGKAPWINPHEFGFLLLTP